MERKSDEVQAQITSITDLQNDLGMRNNDFMKELTSMKAEE